MSISRRVDKLEERTPRNGIQWDGKLETAEAFVKAMVRTFDGNGPLNISEFKGTLHEAKKYIQSEIE